MPIYMKIDGVKGDVTAHGYEDWHEVLSFSWGESNAGTSQQGAGGGGGAGKVSMSDLNVMLVSGKGHPRLMYTCAAGRQLPAVQMEVVFSRDGDLETYQRWSLRQVQISSLQTSGSGGEPPVTSVSLGYNVITFEQAIPSPNGNTVFQSMTWDLTRNTGSANP